MALALRPRSPLREMDWQRPSVLAVLAVALVCVPQQRAQLDSSFNVTAADVAAGCLVVAALVHALRARLRLPRRAYLLAPPAVAVTAATLASVDVVAALPGFVRYLEIFVIVPLAMAIVVRDEVDRRLVAAAVLGAALVQALLGCWQAYSGSGASYGGQSIRAVGTFGAVDVMGMATVVCYGAIVALALVLTTRGRPRVAAALVLIVLLAALVLSLSRGAWLAWLMAGVVMILLSGSRRAVGGALAGALVLGLVVLGGWGSGTVTQRLASMTSVASQPDQSVNDRYGLWETAGGMWHDHPLLGVGPRGFAAWRDNYAPLHVSASSDTADPVNGFQRQELRSPHNMYLLVLSEQGLLGLTAFALMWAGLAVWAAKRARRGRTPAQKAAGLCAAGFLTWQLVDFVYADVGGSPTVVMSIMIGLLLSWVVAADAA
ncbi:O-antigen ligase family protein [Nonomuraea endophytica]|uniref:O-antigen ligase n=1 Tax=Nonomuraea endophytica TaxID=714136 RepID=A0A7W8A9H9_9ACTN|nr:O-antigen ligase family protein [Nonomuraea endophytica]MBB5082094.1 O-antigen ligase [Nonomuraea endophytica]